jgi:organic radical activating enzyme
MNVISTNINQFNQLNCNSNLQSIDTVFGILDDPTVSLCHHCYQHIPAHTYHLNGAYWLSKTCRIHGTSHHMIERDYDFVKKLVYNKKDSFNSGVLIEVSDRCNADCPHCYHMPDNKIADKSIKDLVNQIESWYQPKFDIILAGAEASLHKNFIELVSTLSNRFNSELLQVMTNGIRFADKKFLKESYNAGLTHLLIGLNHIDYLKNKNIRRKQIQGIVNANELNIPIGYIGYTMSSINELEDILEETTNNDWHPKTYRIRYGSDIGRYPDQPRMYVSDIVKITKQWCDKNNKNFKILDHDNNIYHVMIDIDGQLYRLIQWCDITDINMEELRSGPWCNFVPDGITNFLHQVIRRDLWKNQNILLPDEPPARYQINGMNDKDKLDFKKLYD